MPYCEYHASKGRISTWGLEVHHIKSRGSGGDDVPENLVTLCWECHPAAHAGHIDKPTLRALALRRIKERGA